MTRDPREWTLHVELIPRHGWSVVVRCEGHTQGCWGSFHTQKRAEKFGRRQIQYLRPITPPGTEVRTGGCWA